MMRLIGILTGSAAAVTALFIAFGVPELTGSNETPEAIPRTAALSPDGETAAEEDIPVQPQTPPAPLPRPVDGIDPPSVNDAPVVSEAIIDLDEAPDPSPAPSTRPPPDVQPSNWYAFWSPFRSELAADGFISELQRTTGLDYRVVKLKPGVYEVAFAYSDPTDRQDKLDRISAATGLDMSGG